MKPEDWVLAQAINSALQTAMNQAAAPHTSDFHSMAALSFNHLLVLLL